MDAKVRGVVTPQRFSTQVIAIFAAGALLFVSIGLYGLLGFVVSERTCEARGVGVVLGLVALRGE